MEVEMDGLVGRTVNALYIDPGEHTLVIETDDGDHIYSTEGDCCSESWFADIVGVKALIGHMVRSAGVAVPDWVDTEDGRGRQEDDSAYGYTLTTDAGHVDIVFRNSSNGYYGGWMTRTESRPTDLRPITEDWSA